MRKNLCALSLVLTATLGIASFPARADDQVNTQNTTQSAGAVGERNDIYQQSDHTSVQDLKKRGGGDAGTQDNLQQTDQSGAAVGTENSIDQRSSTVNVQQREQRPVRRFDDYRR
ncbi:MAG: filamentous hemagglutinin [Acaryochloris sp. RU_4_1]|nr:filamentous hemagglutinin [Acaryochloris sp. RU_4_1]